MPETTYQIALSAEDSIRVEFTTEGGQVVAFVAQYETVIDEERKPVVRYDSAHGKGHCDVLDWNGHTIRKDWLDQGDDFAASLTFAIDQLETTWARHLADFLRRRP